MRRALVLFAFFACVPSTAANAQRALAQTVTLPSGVSVARTCKQVTAEGVVVASLDQRPLPSSSGEFFAQLAQTIARRVDMPAGDPPRSAVYAAILLRDGSLARRLPVQQSGQRTLDARIDDALAMTATDADRVQSIDGMPDSLRVIITLGQHEDGSPFVATHTRCPAVAYPDNPAPTMPERVIGRTGGVTVRVVVTPAGRVDTATAHVDEASDERLDTAAMDAISRMRFVPAEFDGAKVSARIEIVVPFASNSAEPAATR